MPQTQHILIVDDDPDICEVLEFNLQSEGYNISIAHSAEEALEQLSESHSLILLDVMMGGMSGYRMAETLHRRGRKPPIIFITAKDTENDLLTGFSVGADDYISKPFSVREVIARVRAVLRRHKLHEPKGKPTPESRLSYGAMSIDLEGKELRLDGEPVLLTKTEFELLALLASHPDTLYSREEIIRKVWSESPYSVTERTVDVHITRLRKKLGVYASALSARVGYGYRFSIDALHGHEA